MTDELWADIPLAIEGVATPLVVADMRKGVGSMFYIDLAGAGGPQEAPGAAVTVWVYLCDWEIWRDGVMLGDSDEMTESGFETLKGAMVGRQVLSIRRSQDNALVIFDLFPGFRIELMEPGNEAAKKPMFMIFEGQAYKSSFVFPDGLVFRPMREES